jgi:hypothetical protein
MRPAENSHWSDTVHLLKTVMRLVSRDDRRVLLAKIAEAEDHEARSRVALGIAGLASIAASLIVIPAAGWLAEIWGSWLIATAVVEVITTLAGMTLLLLGASWLWTHASLIRIRGEAGRYVSALVHSVDGAGLSFEQAALATYRERFG